MLAALHPAAFALAAIITLAALWLALARRKNSRRWRTACILLPAAAALAAALALADITVLSNPRARSVVILLDVSPSTRSSALRDPAWLRALATQALDSSTKLTVVGFGGTSPPRLLLEDATINSDAGWPTAWAAADLPTHEGSDLSLALAWRTAAELSRPTPPAPRWVITDGYVQNDAAIQSRPPSAMPFDLAWSVVSPREADLGILDIEAQRQAGGAEILARVAATGEAEGSLQFLRDGVSIGEQTIQFSQAGTRWVSLRDAAAGEPHQYTVTITRTSGGGADRWPENDRAACQFTPADQPARILLVGQPLPALGSFDTTCINPLFFPTDPAQLARGRWQAIVLNDLPALPPAGGSATEILPAYAAPVLSAFVRDTGGGLLILGRNHAFGPGRYPEMGAGPDTLEGLSPVASAQRNRPAVTVIFLLDASGSMNEGVGTPVPQQKFRLAARAVEQTMPLLLDSDRVAIVTFNDHARVIADAPKGELLQATGGETALRKKLDTVQPTGSTVPDAAIADLVRLLGVKDNQQPQTKILVLLTDGEIPAMQVPRWNNLLATSGCTLNIVAPPPQPASPLQQIAQANHAAWLRADDSASWAPLLRRSVADQLTGKVRDKPIAWHTLHFPPTELHGTAPESIEVWAKSNARILAEMQGQNPPPALAAIVQRGLGQVAALAMAPGTDAHPYDELLTRIIHQIQAPAGDPRFNLRLEREGDHWRIQAQAIDAGHFWNGLSLRFEYFTPADSQPRITQMPQIAPGEYAGVVSINGPLSGTVVSGAGHAARLVGYLHGGDVAAAEWPASYDAPPQGPPHGATAIPPDDKSARRWNPRLRQSRWPLSPILWIVAAAFTLAALWARRQ